MENKRTRNKREVIPFLIGTTSHLFLRGRTITECIREGILEEFLMRNRSEAKRMSIYEYDQAKHIRQEREEAWEEGKREGKDRKVY